MGKSPEDLAKSVFVEKLHARGYEVLLLGQPLDEIFLQNLGNWKYVPLTLTTHEARSTDNVCCRKLPFQDVAKSGLKFGDEDEDPAEEKARQKELTEQYKPLLDWFKKEVGEIVRNGGFPFFFEWTCRSC